MSWTYSGDPDFSAKDAIRFLIGDTNPQSPLVSDEEIAYALSVASDGDSAAALITDALAARYATLVDETVGPLSRSNSQIAAAYRTRSGELRGGGLALAEMFVGGISHSGKRALDSNADGIRPIFRRGMDDAPGSGQDPGSNGLDPRLNGGA